MSIYHFILCVFVLTQLSMMSICQNEVFYDKCMSRNSFLLCVCLYGVFMVCVYLVIVSCDVCISIAYYMMCVCLDYTCMSKWSFPCCVCVFKYISICSTCLLWCRYCLVELPMLCVCLGAIFFYDVYMSRWGFFDVCMSI